jgi:3',5'-nucleoside bisphosphate phosphatase
MNRRTLLQTLLAPAAFQAERPNYEGKRYFDVVREMYPVRTGMKLLARTEIQFPKLGEFQVVTGDFHVHTLYSEGTVMPSVRLYEAWTEGVDVVSITDHTEFLTTSLPEKKGRAFSEVADLAKALDLVLIRGAEVSTVYSAENEMMTDVVRRSNTDFIVLFVQDENALFAPFDIAMERARQQGCLNIWAHPGSQWRPIPEKFLQMGWLHGVEIRNTVTAGRSNLEEFRGRYFYPQVADWGKEKQLALIASSDVHSPAQFERLPSKPRDFTLLLVKERSPEGVREAILAKRTMAWFEGMLWGRAADLELLARRSLSISALPGSGRTQALRVRNASSFPFEIQCKAAQKGWTVPTRALAVPPLGTIVLPASRDASQQPASLQLTLANVFTSRQSNLDLVYEVAL